MNQITSSINDASTPVELSSARNESEVAKIKQSGTLPHNRQHLNMTDLSVVDESNDGEVSPLINMGEIFHQKNVL